jgi:hypothetical protein
MSRTKKGGKSGCCPGCDYCVLNKLYHVKKQESVEKVIKRDKFLSEEDYYKRYVFEE